MGVGMMRNLGRMPEMMGFVLMRAATWLQDQIRISMIRFVAILCAVIFVSSLFAIGLYCVEWISPGTGQALLHRSVDNLQTFAAGEWVPVLPAQED
jgi:hypothetical protein